MAKKTELREQKFNPEKWRYNEKHTLSKVNKEPCKGLGAKNKNKKLTPDLILPERTPVSN